MIQMNELKTIYFLGIGGIGMSALARYFNYRGVKIYGYDKTPTTLTDALQQEGMTIHFEDSISLIPENIDLVIYTPAIPKNLEEWIYIQKNISPEKILKRSQVLGLISRNMKTIAVAGTHGKTSTTSIITHLLRVGGIDCTAFLGGISTNLNSNFVIGKSEWCVVEADEFDKSFLQLNPTIAVINSLDADHLDIYGTHEIMLNTYHEFIDKIQENGTFFYKKDLKISTLRKDIQCLNFGIEKGEIQAKNINIQNNCYVFDFYTSNIQIENLAFPFAGRHNIENATVAISIALQLGVKPEHIREGLRSFSGIKRRFEYIVQTENRVFIDDYAHHPEELRAAISAARELYPDKRLVGIFQPHLYTRTRDFADGFAEVLDTLDEPILLEIYPARELPIQGIDAQFLLNKMKNPYKKILTKDAVVPYLKRIAPELLMTLGAGDIDKLLPSIADIMIN